MSLRDYSMNLTEDAYHAYPAWSYSIIARYAKDGFSSLATLHDPVATTPSMEFGSLFDSIITKGKKTLDEYKIVSMSVPEAERKALDYISTATHVSFENIPAEDLMRYCDQCQYQTRWGYDARFKHLVTYQDYYDAKRSGKKLVSEEDWSDAMEMFKKFRDNELLRNLFGTKDEFGIEYIYQSQFCEEYVLEKSGRTVSIKIMPDLIKIDHNEKTIQPVDLKTSAMPAYSFWENFVKFRYDIQAELYTDILTLVINKDPELKDYTIKKYLFADISRSDKEPVTWIYDQFTPFSYTKNGQTYTYKGWEQLLEEILDYEETQAKVPSYISTTEPNDIIEALSR